MGELDLSGMILDQRGDEHPITKEVNLSPTQLKVEFFENMAPSPFDIPHQSLIEDVLEPQKTITTMSH